MGLGYIKKSSYFTDQISIADYWIREANRVDGPFVRFTCYYSALNALAWCLSGESRDRQIFNDLKKKICSLDINQDAEVITASRSMLEGFKNSFPAGIHNLSRQGTKGGNSEIEFDLPDNGKVKFTDVDLGGLPEDQLIWLSIGLIYQFRCNLVHGTKNPADVSNEAVVALINRSIKCWIELIRPHSGEVENESKKIDVSSPSS